MTAAPVTVVFIEGAGRSGTTLLDTMLGQLDGFFSTGELRYVWERNVLADELCGCGLPFSACDVWQQVMDVAFHGDRPDARQLIQWRDQALRVRHLPALLAGRGRERIRHRAVHYLSCLGQLYNTIAEVTGAEVIVDSSKVPTHGYLLGLVPGIEVVSVHVIRDPRAVVHSWRRRKLDPRHKGKLAPMAQYPLVPAARAWLVWNALSEGFARRSSRARVQVRYEDFVAHPEDVVAEIAQRVGRNPGATSFLGHQVVELEATHTVGGNPDRHRTGTVRLRRDEAWQTGLSRRDQALVTAVCWPLMRRYGYLQPRVAAASTSV